MSVAGGDTYGVANGGFVPCKKALGCVRNICHRIKHVRMIGFGLQRGHSTVRGRAIGGTKRRRTRRGVARVKLRGCSACEERGWKFFSGDRKARMVGLQVCGTMPFGCKPSSAF